MIHARLRRRFTLRVEKRGASACHLWCGAQSADGYGIFYAYGKRLAAHRFAYAIHHELDLDEVPTPLGHTCGNRHCVNPEHLVTRKTVHLKGGYKHGNV